MTSMMKLTPMAGRMEDMTMQAIMETSFDIAYLVTVITLGFLMVVKSRDERQFRLFGIMALVLGFGDAFHLVPRAVALCTTGLQDYTVALGFGKLVTSITMTVFYVILFHVWRLRYHVEGRKDLDYVVYVFAAVRMALCLFPQNRWFSEDSPLSWGILRNIPFAALGLAVIILFYKSAHQHDDKAFRWMWLTIVLSFAFYIPVVLFADKIPMIGMLMIPKTCAYVWTVAIGCSAMRRVA